MDQELYDFLVFGSKEEDVIERAVNSLNNEDWNKQGSELISDITALPIYSESFLEPDLMPEWEEEMALNNIPDINEEYHNLTGQVAESSETLSNNLRYPLGNGRSDDKEGSESCSTKSEGCLSDSDLNEVRTNNLMFSTEDPLNINCLQNFVQVTPSYKSLFGNRNQPDSGNRVSYYNYALYSPKTIPTTGRPEHSLNRITDSDLTKSVFTVTSGLEGFDTKSPIISPQTSCNDEVKCFDNEFLNIPSKEIIRTHEIIDKLDNHNKESNQLPSKRQNIHYVSSQKMGPVYCSANPINPAINNFTQNDKKMILVDAGSHNDVQTDENLTSKKTGSVDGTFVKACFSKSQIAKNNTGSSSNGPTQFYPNNNMSLSQASNTFISVDLTGKEPKIFISRNGEEDEKYNSEDRKDNNITQISNNIQDQDPRQIHVSIKETTMNEAAEIMTIGGSKEKQCQKNTDNSNDSNFMKYYKRSSSCYDQSEPKEKLMLKISKNDGSLVEMVSIDTKKVANTPTNADVSQQKILEENNLIKTPALNTEKPKSTFIKIVPMKTPLSVLLDSASSKGHDKKPSVSTSSVNPPKKYSPNFYLAENSMWSKASLKKKKSTKK